MMNENEKAQQNMISNLPLLFANGYPTSLEKITERQLENFIPFMVQCSLGQINLSRKAFCSEPEWWPEDLPFGIPLTKPKDFICNWMEKMKEIVVICYQFHKSLFLLRFCNDLASYEHASLRFINNFNSTTSLYDRRSNKLLVTFRNENMSYDQQQSTRKCLFQRKVKTGDNENADIEHIMVESAPFDIYLCDSCDAELYSKEAVMEHEKTCSVEDDVIVCDSPEPEVDVHFGKENHEQREAFLLNFNLQSCESNRTLSKSENAPNSIKEETVKNIAGSSIRLSRRNRTAHSLNRCPSIPLSSPAGQHLLRTTKIGISLDYLSERLERIERFCHTPLLLKSSFNSKIFEKKLANNTHCTFKRPQEYSTHIYAFPRRQFSHHRQILRKFMFLNSPLIKKCRPIAVRLKKITENILAYQRNPSNINFNIRLTRDTSRNSNWRITHSTEVIVDTIDLCSSDEDDNCSSIAKPFPTLYVENNICDSSSQNCDNNYNSSFIISNSDGRTIDGKPFYCNDVGNVLYSPTYTQPTHVSEDSLLKPLQKSVYLYSNYKTDSVTNRYIVDTLPSHSVSTNINTVNHSGIAPVPHKENNQENCTLPKNIIELTDWCSKTKNSNKSTNMNQSSDISCESISVLPAFTTPGRIISIDLTT